MEKVSFWDSPVKWMIIKAIENHEKKQMIDEMYEERKAKEKALYEERQRRIDAIDKELGLKESEDK